ncbi:MAG: DNA primase small subunit domain-containing protein [Candidatus Thorarchaeota archaeon]
MDDIVYLKRLFQAYYKEKSKNLPQINLFNKREFGFIPWDKQTIMKRHMSFNTIDNLTKYLIIEAPRHIYSSGSIYSHPDNSDMIKKQYQGCDLIFDIDVDHFYTACKNDHDIWYCLECGSTGTGMQRKCPKCKKLKIKSLTWICEACLKVAKIELIKLIYQFLIPDFGISIEKMKIAFSGHRGYHLKIEDEEVRNLTGEERREIASYISGNNISLDMLGLRKHNEVIYGLLRENIGWSQKIINKIDDVLKNTTDNYIKTLLTKFGLNANAIKSFLNFKSDFLQTISRKNYNIWNIEGFGLQTWSSFLKGFISEIGVEIDEPVSIDIHRLIRYPGSIHGKTGFIVQELYPDQLDDFNPLNEWDESLDPIVFKSENKITQKLEIIEPKVPLTTIKGESYGPYNQGEKIEVPHHFAVFLLCKGVAKIV